MEKVAIYIRVSKKEQSKDNGSESSLNIQLKKCLDYCKEKNYEVLKVYQDIESGRIDDRKEFNELFEAISKKIYTKIVFWEVSRIARKISTGMKFFEELELYKITFDSISQPYLKDFMTLSIFLAWGAEDIKQMSLRIRSNLEEKTKAGYFVHGNPATGYIRGENKMIVPDPEKAPFILKIFETYAETHNLSEVGRRFKKTRSDIVEIIDNKIYIGYVPFRRYVKELNEKKRKESRKNIKWYKGLHEPIVPLELFEFCQALREKNMKVRASFGNAKPYLLYSSLIYCKCGCKMYQQKRKKSYETKNGKVTRTYYSYTCVNRKCRKVFSAKTMDKAIKDLILNSKELEELNQYSSKDKKNEEKKFLKLKNDLKLLENEKERVINLFQKGYINEEELDNKFKDINNDLKITKEKVTEFEKILNISTPKDIKILEKLKFIIENYDEEDIVETKKILKILIKEIRIISFKPLKLSILFY